MNSLNSDQSYLNLRSGLVLYPNQQDALESILTNLFNQISARFLMLADVTGQPISTRGEQSKINVVAVASLVAGDLAASQEIARLTGQYSDYQMVLREGETSYTLIIEAGHHLALLVQASTETPIGWARMATQKAAQRLGEVVAEPPPETNRPIDASSESFLPEDDIADLLGDALDDLWSTE